MEPNQTNPNQNPENTSETPNPVVPEAAPAETPADPIPTAPVTSEPTAPTQPVADRPNKKLVYAVIGALGLLLAILIALVVLLANKKDDASTDKTATTSASQQTDKQVSADTSDKKIIKTIPTKDENISLVLYEPRQTGSNTTIDFALKNTCTGCQNTTYTSLGDAVGYSYSNVKNDYLLDEDAGQKYNPIVDEDGKILMTPETNASLKAGETSKDMFIAFTKVPSGTTVSLVLNSLRVDGIQIP